MSKGMRLCQSELSTRKSLCEERYRFVKKSLHTEQAPEIPKVTGIPKSSLTWQHVLT